MGNGRGAFLKAQASDVAAARSFDIALAIFGTLRSALDIALFRGALSLFGKAGLRVSALLQVFAGILALAADEAAVLAATLQAAEVRLAALAQGRGFTLFLACLPGRALSARLTIFLIALPAQARLLRAEIALLVQGLLTLLLARFLLPLLAELL